MAECSGALLQAGIAYSEHIPCQLAVYHRRTTRDRFCFSHVRNGAITKWFPESLSVKKLSRCEEIKKANEQAYKTAPVLILVTGNRGEMVSCSSLSSKKRAIFKYDHAERETISEEQRLGPNCSELNRGYMAMSVNCTLACYERGRANDWRITNVIPMLSDWIVIPRVIGQGQVEIILRSYAKAAKKGLADSLYLAGNQRFRESNLSEVQRLPMQDSPANENEKL